MAYQYYRPVQDRGEAALRPPFERNTRVNVDTTERALSLAAGGLLSWAALGRDTPLPKPLLLALGGALLYRGYSGHCHLYGQLGVNTAVPPGSAAPTAPLAVPAKEPGVVEIDESLTVNRPRSEVYAFWQELENLPRFMSHLQSVTRTGPGITHWVARLPKNLGTLEWDAETLEDEPNRVIAWRSLAGADIHNAGRVEFADATGGRGTRVRVRIDYRPPGGAVGRAVAGLFNPAFSQMVKQEVRRFRSLLETGEIPTTQGQPTGRR